MGQDRRPCRSTALARMGCSCNEGRTRSPGSGARRSVEPRRGSPHQSRALLDVSSRAPTRIRCRQWNGAISSPADSVARSHQSGRLVPPVCALSRPEARVGGRDRPRPHHHCCTRTLDAGVNVAGRRRAPNRAWWSAGWSGSGPLRRAHQPVGAGDATVGRGGRRDEADVDWAADFRTARAVHPLPLRWNRCPPVTTGGPTP